MSLFKLVFRNLLRHPVRTGLTALAAVIAMFLLIVLRSLLTTIDDAVTAVAANRIATQSAVSLFKNLPENYRDKIASVEGVESVCRWQWFGGVYKDPANFFAQFGIDADTFLDQYPECVITAAEREAFMADRRACIIGKGLADRFGFEVGKTVPILGTIFTRPEDQAWEFNVVGVYESSRANLDEGTLFFHYDYLRETLENGEAEGPQGVGVFMIKLAAGHGAPAVSERIDAIFSGGPQRTRTQTEAAFSAGFVTMLGNIPTFIGWIGAAVLFALLLTLVNTFLISAGERTRDIGVLKALGFSDGTCGRLLLGEALLVAVGGGLIGIGLAYGSVPGMKVFLGNLPGLNLSGYAIRPSTGIAALVVAVITGLIAGLVPAIRATRLEVAETFSEEL